MFLNAVIFLVPMDLDVKMKAVMLGACFLIVSVTTMHLGKLCHDKIIQNYQ